MFGQYKRLRNEFTGVLTGKEFLWGSLIDLKLQDTERLFCSKYVRN
jgi:glutamate dehydrogenase/leucine dehydrogenase